MSNLTAYQIQEVLDTPLYSGIEAIFNSGSDFVERQLLGLLSWSTRNNRHKISHKEKSEQLSCLVNILYSKSAFDKLKFYILFRPDRYITFGILNKFVTACNGYAQHMVNQDYDQCRVIERELGVHPAALYGLLSQVKDCIEVAYRFRNQIAENYIGLCKQEATKLKSGANIRLLTDDLSQNLTRAVFTALDKFDHSRGALTSYIRIWMRDVWQSPEHGHEAGMAYDIPYAFRSKIESTGVSNFSQNLDDAITDSLEKADPSTLSIIEASQAETEVLLLLKQVDPLGLLRMNLGIEESVCPILQAEMLADMQRTKLLNTVVVPTRNQ